VVFSDVGTGCLKRQHDLDKSAYDRQAGGLKVKSRLFSAFSEKSNEDFSRDLARLLALGPEHQGVYLEAFPAFALARMSSEGTEIARSVEAQTGHRQADVTDVFALLVFFMDKILFDRRTREDTVDAWADDLIELSLMAEESREKFVTLMQKLKDDILPGVRDDALSRRYEIGLLPSLTEFGATVEMRAVRRDPYDPLSKIEEYTPDIVAATPVVSLHVGVNTGAVTDFFFQADESELDMIIRSLQAAKKDMSALKEFLAASRTRSEEP
jgi:hypothetical protein